MSGKYDQYFVNPPCTQFEARDHFNSAICVCLDQSNKSNCGFFSF